jgi:hypothetical protein
MANDLDGAQHNFLLLYSPTAKGGSAVRSASIASRDSRLKVYVWMHNM